MLFGRENSHAVGFQLAFVHGTVIAVSGEAVKLVHDDRLKGLVPAVGDHSLKLRTVGSCAADRTVDVLSDDVDALRRCKRLAFPKLPLNGLLSLPVAAVTGVDHCIHV